MVQRPVSVLNIHNVTVHGIVIVQVNMLSLVV